MRGDGTTPVLPADGAARGARLAGLAALLLLAGWLATLLARPINLATSDLGRHITTGRLLLQGDTAVLSRNAYALTQGDYPAWNHHWGAGVVFYLVERLGGFRALSALGLALNALAFLAFTGAASRRFGLSAAVTGSVWLIPLLASRVDVRPEYFSSLALGGVYALLSSVRAGAPARRAWLVIPIVAVWANLHIFWILGLFVVGCFAIESLWCDPRGREWRTIAGAGLAGFLASALTPLGYHTTIEPFRIFRDYAYPIVETEPVWVMARLVGDAKSWHAIAAVALTFVLAGWLAWRRRLVAVAAAVLVPAGLAVLTLRMNRFAVPLAFTLGPLCAACVAPVLAAGRGRARAAVAWSLSGALLLAAVLSRHPYLSPLRVPPRLGLYPGIDRGGRFLRALRPEGPIFNNYDLGGYLIYFLYPRYRVFVDNRPEAYPGAFFRDVVIPMQSDEAVWRATLERYRFNVICFYVRDFSDWGRPFLARRLRDPGWLSVYQDFAVAVLLRNTEANRERLDDLRARIRRGEVSDLE